MPRPEFRRSAVRRRPSPIVESLEGRALLNATSLTKMPAIEVHAEVTKLTVGQVKAEKAEAKHLKQEKAAEAKAAKKEAAAEAKFAKLEASDEAKAAKTGVAAEKKTLVGTALAGETVTKVGSPLTDTYIIQPAKLHQGVTQALQTTPLPGQYTPAQLQNAYGVNELPNQGLGVTIGIVDEFDDTAITSDANIYSTQYGLPIFNSVGGPVLSVVKDTTSGAVGSAVGTNVAGETSLDVELAHAMAPMANILLVEVSGTALTYKNLFASLLQGVQYAAGQSINGAPVVSVSLSYGTGEANIGNSAAVTLQNNTYLATGAASNIAVTVSTGDSSSPSYPATSPNVVAVGGTSLFLASAQGDYDYETAWGGFAFPAAKNGYSSGAGGGGPSADFPAPAFQYSHGVAVSANRTIPDISLVADPYTGVSIYDSLDGYGWTGTGGTSVSSPMFAGILALAQQDRLAAGQSLLTSAQIDNSLYTAYTNPTTYADLFNDVTLGKNTYLNPSTSGNPVKVAGYSATTGYDLATGLGSPWAAYMIPYLVNGIDPGAAGP